MSSVKSSQNIELTISGDGYLRAGDEHGAVSFACFSEDGAVPTVCEIYVDRPMLIAQALQDGFATLLAFGESITVHVTGYDTDRGRYSVLMAGAAPIFDAMAARSRMAA